MQNHAAPGLANGLAIIEMLARSSGPLGFSAIHGHLEVARGTTSRLLHVLQDNQWVTKDTESQKYVLTNRIRTLMQPIGRIENFTQKARECLASLAVDASNSCVAISWNGKVMECVDKEVNMESIPMQSVGKLVSDLGFAPWGWVIYSELSKAEKKLAETRIADLERFKKEIPAWLEFYETNGYAYDCQYIHTHLRRLGAPVRDRSGCIVGALGIGGNVLTIHDKNVQRIGNLLVEYADRLSEQLGWAGTNGAETKKRKAPRCE